MTSRTLPGIGLTAFWDLHSDGWKDAMDSNLQTISALLVGGVKSRTTALPASPTDGDIYIVPSSATSNANKIAIRDSSTWYYVTPANGMEVYVIDSNKRARYLSGAWSDATYTTSGGGSSSSTLIGITAAHLAADFTVTSGAWRSPTSWAIDHDNLSAYTSNSDFTVPSGAAFCRVTMQTAWGSAGAVVYTQAYDTTDNTSYAGDIRDHNNEALSTIDGPYIACTPGHVIRFQYNSGSATGGIGGASGTVFGKPCRIQIEWYSGWPI